MWLAGIFNMLTYTAATSYVADIFLRRVRVWFRVTVYTQLAVGVYWDSTPLTASAEIFKVYISFTLFTCDCTLIYTLMYCVCQHTDPGMAQIHRGLTDWGRGATPSERGAHSRCTKRAVGRIVHGIPSHLCSQELVSSTLGIERLTSIREYLHKTKTKGKLCVRGRCTHHPSWCARACVG